MKINKSNALAFASTCIKRAEAISMHLKTRFESDKKYNLKNNYDSEFAEIDQMTLLAKKAMNIHSPGYSFAENSETSLTKFQLRENVASVAMQIKNISACLLKQIEKEVTLLIDNDFSSLLKKIESSLKVINSELKLYKDESNWLFAESQIDYGKNKFVRGQIGSRVPLLGRLVDALALQIKKENNDNSTKDHTKLLIKLVESLKSFDENLKPYSNNPNAPTIQINKLLNNLTSSSFGSKESSVKEFATISAEECEKLMSESDCTIPGKLPDDRNELHKLILAVMEKQKVSYDKALKILRGKK